MKHAATDVLASQEAWLCRVRQQAATARLHRWLGLPPIPEQPIDLQEFPYPQRLPDLPEDALRARKHEILQRERRWLLVENQPSIAALAQRAEQEIADFIPRINGSAYTRADLVQMLHADDRQLRRAAWYAEEPLAQRLAGMLRDLVELRKTHAARHGASSYFHLVMERREAEPTWAQSLLEELEQRTLPLYQQLLMMSAERHGISEPKPWDLDYLAAVPQPAPTSLHNAFDLVREVYRRLGIDFATAAFQIHALPNLPLPAVCVVVHPPQEVHILYRDSRGVEHALVHEIAHALAATTARVDYWLTLESPILDEGIAEAFTLWAAALLPAFKEATPSEAEGQFGALLRLRRHLLNAHLEIMFYAHPTDALSDLYIEAHRRFLLSAPEQPCERFAARHLLYSQPFQPVVYLLADVLAAQVAAAAPLARGANLAETGTWVAQHFWKEAALHPWREKLARATHQDLSPQAPLARFGIC